MYNVWVYDTIAIEKPHGPVFPDRSCGSLRPKRRSGRKSQMYLNGPPVAALPGRRPYETGESNMADTRCRVVPAAAEGPEKRLKGYVGKPLETMGRKATELRRRLPCGGLGRYVRRAAMANCWKRQDAKLTGG